MHDVIDIALGILLALAVGLVTTALVLLALALLENIFRPRPPAKPPRDDSSSIDLPSDFP